VTTHKMSFIQFSFYLIVSYTW